MRSVLRPLAAVMLVQALVTMAITSVPVLAPDLAASTGIAARWIGFYSSLAFAGAMCSIILGGALTRRAGALRMSQISLAVAAAALVLTTLGPVPAIVTGAFLAGFGYGLATPAASHILARLTPATMRGVVFSLKQSAVPLGGLITGLSVPVIVVAVDWRAGLLTVAGLIAAAIVIIHPLRRRLDDDRDPAFPFSVATPFQAMRYVIGHRQLRVLAATAFVFAAMQVSMVAIFVTFLVERAALSLVTAGIVFAVMQFTGVIARVGLGWLSDHIISARSLLALMGIGIALSMTLASAIDADWPLAAILVVAVMIGTSVTGWAGIYLAEIARLVPQAQVSTATAGTVFYSFLGAVLGPSGFSLIAAGTGSYSPALIAYGLAAGAIALALFALSRRPNGAE